MGEHLKGYHTHGKYYVDAGISPGKATHGDHLKCGGPQGIN